jgi:hypothetical protein
MVWTGKINGVSSPAKVVEIAFASIEKIMGVATSLHANTTFLNEDMSNITDWSNGDTGNGVSSQTTFDSKSCMLLDSNVATTPNYAYRYRDVGSFVNRVVVEIYVYIDATGISGSNDTFDMEIYRNDVGFRVRFASDGLFVYNGALWNEVGTNLIVQDTWQLWLFDIDFTTPASAVVDIYRNGSSVGSDIDCSDTGSYTNGHVYLHQYGYNANDRIAYIDYIKIGDAFA